MRVLNDLIATTQCCGLRELSGIAGNTPEDIMYTVAVKRRQGRNMAHIVFTDNSGAQEEHYSDRLVEYIREHGLGDVVSTQYVRNPNSGNMLKAFLYTPDHNALDSWLDGKLRVEMERAGLEIGGFYRYVGNGPNSYEGRACLLNLDNGVLTFCRKDTGTEWRVNINEAENLTKTRPFILPERYQRLLGQQQEHEEETN